MRTLRRMSLVVAGLLLAGAAACTNAPTPGPSASATTPPPPPCPVGSWKSSGVTASATAAGITLTINGGSGVKVTIGPDGKVMADFSNMQPATFTTQVNGTPVAGEISYTGPINGAVDLSGAATATPSPGAPTASATASTPTTPTTSSSGAASGAGMSGAWTPTGPVDVSALQLTVKLTQPVGTTLVNGVHISQVSGSQTSQTGNAVDLQPLLRPGTYQCNGENTLVITTTGNGPTLVWTLTRG
jgi:hypothetical protein